MGLHVLYLFTFRTRLVYMPVTGFEITEVKKYILSSCQNTKVIQMTKKEYKYETAVHDLTWQNGDEDECRFCSHCRCRGAALE